MPTSRADALRLLEQAKRQAWWGTQMGRMGWALDHIFDFATGFFATFTPSYDLTLTILRRMGRLSPEEYDAMYQDSAARRAGLAAGVAVAVVMGNLAQAKAGGTMISIYLGNSLNPKVITLNSVQSMELLYGVMQGTNMFVAPID